MKMLVCEDSDQQTDANSYTSPKERRSGTFSDARIVAILRNLPNLCEVTIQADDGSVQSCVCGITQD
jgi:hypothetical protein